MVMASDQTMRCAEHDTVFAVGGGCRDCAYPNRTWIPAHVGWRDPDTGQRGTVGYWFPPATCDHHGIGRNAPALCQPNGGVALNRIYTVDDCAECLANLQAIEIMLQGIVWVLKQWPEQWEHRCWHGVGRNGWKHLLVCTCGRLSLLDAGWLEYHGDRILVEDLRWGDQPLFTFFNESIYRTDIVSTTQPMNGSVTLTLGRRAAERLGMSEIKVSL